MNETQTEPTVIKPEVGRHVHYYPKSSCHEFGHCVLGGRPHAAVVTAVHSDRLVNLVVFDANGKSFGRTSVLLRQPGDPESQYDRCEWMPCTVASASASAKQTS